MPEITYQVIQKPIDERLIDAACIYWNVERSYFSQKSTKAELVQRKSIVYYLLKMNCPTMAYEAIAGKFGFSSHQAVMRAVDEIESRMGIYQQICNDVNSIRSIADTLDAQFITTNIQLHNRKPQ